MNINTEVYKVMIGQIIRHFLVMAAGVLTSIGVERGVFDTAVNATVPLLTAALFAGIAFLYGYLEKKGQIKFNFNMIEAAFLANPSQTNLSEVKATVLAKKSTPDLPI